MRAQAALAGEVLVLKLAIEQLLSTPMDGPAAARGSAGPVSDDRHAQPAADTAQDGQPPPTIGIMMPMTGIKNGLMLISSTLRLQGPA